MFYLKKIPTIISIMASIVTQITLLFFFQISISSAIVSANGQSVFHHDNRIKKKNTLIVTLNQINCGAWKNEGDDSDSDIDSNNNSNSDSRDGLQGIRKQLLDWYDTITSKNDTHDNDYKIILQSILEQLGKDLTFAFNEEAFAHSGHYSATPSQLAEYFFNTQGLREEYPSIKKNDLVLLCDSSGRLQTIGVARSKPVGVRKNFNSPLLPSLFIEYILSSPKKEFYGGGMDLINEMINRSQTIGYSGRIALEATDASVKFYQNLGFTSIATTMGHISFSHRNIYGLISKDSIQAFQKEVVRRKYLHNLSL
ncbi:MAG: hypothetical protein HQK53_15860 [Oligoflexia bacterium]|nr:hypothetical protein [Oligoflexia bacterium]